MSDSKKFVEAANELVNIIPESYQDVLQPSAKQIGGLLERIPRAINAALSGIDIWISQKEYDLAEIKRLLEIKLTNVNPEKIVPPAPYVAVPAFQSMSYSMSNAELKELYANLLAASMNSDFMDYVHPSFVEIIKQMSPKDAENFKYFTSPLPVARYVYQDALLEMVNSDFIFLSNPLESDLSIQSQSISSLKRLGLIEVTFEKHFESPCYDPFYETTLFKEYQHQFDNQYPISCCHVLEGVAYATPLGNVFMKTCCAID